MYKEDLKHFTFVKLNTNQGKKSPGKLRWKEVHIDEVASVWLVILAESHTPTASIVLFKQRDKGSYILFIAIC